MGPWQRRWQGDTPDRSSKESPTCTATWLYTETSKVTPAWKCSILIGFVTSEHTHIHTRDTGWYCLNNVNVYNSYCRNCRRQSSHNWISSFGNSPCTEGAWKNVLFWTPLWDKLGFVLVKLARLKMFNTGWKGFSLAACSFGSHSIVQRWPRKGKYTVWWGKKMVGLTGHRLYESIRGWDFPLRKAL